MLKKKAAQKIQEQVKVICELIGNPADFSVLPVGNEALFSLVYLSSLANDYSLERGIALLKDLGDSLVTTTQEQRNFQYYEDLEAAAKTLLEGNMLAVSADAVFSIEAQGWLRRLPTEPVTERLIRGPREGFTETLEDNIGMVRRWIRDPDLKVEALRVGRRTQTRVVIMYLSDLTQPGLVEEIQHRIKAIDIDGVLEAGYLEQLITDRRATIFPLIQATERSDRVAAALLEGRVAILIDKSPACLIVPATVNELYQTPEDYYFNYWLGSFLRLIRLLGNNLAVALPGLYIALAVYHPELLPTNLAMAIAASRSRVPIPLIAEVFILLLAVEFFREAGLRLPGSVAHTLGVVAGIVLGMTAVQAGFVSSATLVVAAITAIASFTGPNYSV
ncbi:MAG: spore germination protein, partial [Firmicutes bacterium]|nr:spore germination protein [Bacillota bacterium]